MIGGALGDERSNSATGARQIVAVRARRDRLRGRRGHFFAGSSFFVMASFFIISSFLTMSAHAASFFAVASSFFIIASFLAIAMWSLHSCRVIDSFFIMPSAAFMSSAAQAVPATAQQA